MRTILCIFFNLFFLWGYTQDFCVTYSSGKTLCFEITSSKTVKIAKGKSIKRYYESFYMDLYLKRPEYGYVFEGSLVIPATVTDKGDTYTVTEVGNLEETNLTSVKIPKTVTRISDNAFKNSEKLTTVILPESLEYIGECAFINCFKLSSITLPNTIKIINEYTFKGCESMQNVTLPASLEEIGAFAFRNCFNLQKITLPSSLKKIGSYAFKDCVYLREIEIPESVEELGYRVFEGCTRLRTIKFPPKEIKINFNNQETDEVDYFEGCLLLEKIIVPFGYVGYYMELFPFHPELIKCYSPTKDIDD